LVEARKEEKTLQLLGILARSVRARLRGKNETASKVVVSRGYLKGGRLKACFVFSSAPRLVSQRAVAYFSSFLISGFVV